MARNDPAQDRYNPPGTNITDFDSIKFGDLEINELFWMNNVLSENNHAYRKLDEKQVLNTKTRIITELSKTTNIYQKL
tara:strand:+ start:279 stop:512 length:234 start_codon:yes stop_codon:yes gene_type:complete